MKVRRADRAVPEGVHRGIFLILLATLCIVLMNACAKVRSVAHGPVKMFFYRAVLTREKHLPYF